MKFLKASSICCLAFSVLLLAGCDVSTPSKVETGEIRVKDVMKTVSIDPMHTDLENVELVAGDYNTNGSGPMRLVVPFAPGNPLNKVAAEAQGEKLRHAFEYKGVKDFRVSYTATVDPSAVAVLSYQALAAEPPAHCHEMAGVSGGVKLSEAEDDNYGCAIKSAESQMVARPADLLGAPGLPEDDAKRQGGLVDKYRTGTPNPALQGLNASGS